MHDTVSDGISAWSGSTLHLSHSLVERAGRHAVVADGSDLSLADLALRDGTNAGDDESMGVVIQQQSQAQLARCLIERFWVGIDVYGSAATIEDSLVRAAGGTQLETTGILVESAAPATLERLVVDGAHRVGVQVRHADATLDAVVVRNVLGVSDGGGVTYGFGVSVWSIDVDGPPASLDLACSLIEHATHAGIEVVSATAQLRTSIVRDVSDGGMPYYDGCGVLVSPEIDHPGAVQPSDAAIAGMRIERTQGAGLLVFGSHVTADALAVRDIAPHAEGDLGDGIVASAYLLEFPEFADASLSLERGSVVGSDRAGLASFGGECYRSRRWRGRAHRP